MNAAALLSSCRSRGLTLTPAPDGGLRCRGPVGLLDADLRQLLAAHKPAILRLLTVEGFDPDTAERYEERAAIAEFDGGLSRDDAEALALSELLP